jgi:competence protein ComEA
MGRTQAIAVSLVLIAVLIGAGLGFSAAPSPEPVPAETLTTSGESRPALVVHVSGWVATPGVVEVAEGSIVADAVAAAGGALDGAMLESLNLAAPVLDGDHIQIPGPGDVIAATGGDQGDGRIALNRADAAALEELPGVGPVLAERIVAHREANGPYQEVEDLLEVSGIGEAKLASIRDLIVVP